MEIARNWEKLLGKVGETADRTGREWRGNW
jgi:hypothetical protein